MTNVAAERDAFEAWYAKRHPKPTHENSTWAHCAKMDDWEVWQARAGAAPAAVAGPAPAGWQLVPATPTREWIASVADGGYEDCDCASLIADILSRAPAAPALEAPPAVAPQGEYPHEQMDAMALARYKVVPSHASMLWSHAVVAGDGAQQLYVGREVECQNMARKFAGAFLDGAFAFHSMAAAPTAHAAPALEAPAAPAIGPKLARIMGYREYYRTWGRQLSDATELVESHPSHWRIVAEAMDELAEALAAAPQAPAAPAVDAREPIKPQHPQGMTSVNARLSFNHGWTAAERAHGIRPAAQAAAKGEHGNG